MGKVARNKGVGISSEIYGELNDEQDKIGRRN